MYGYWKKLLRINLTTKTATVESIDEKDLMLLYGGSGLGAKILLEEVPPKVDPLSPENKIIFALGWMQAANYPGNAKWSVITKGPLTGSFLDSAGTGAWAPDLKKAGYEALVIEGKADSPLYLYISNDNVEFKNASHLWGKDAVVTSEIIKEELGNKSINALNIGPAGEILNPIACITCDGHSFAGRGGAGAVMGSKNLKAVAVRGSKQVEVYDPEGAKGYGKELMGQLHKLSKGNNGTTDAIIPFEELGDSPIRYWRGDVWHTGAKKIAAPNYNKILNVKPLPCQNCPIACHRHVEFEYNGKTIVGNGPEYETMGMMGSSLLNDDIKAIAVANDTCNRAGVDTISMGSFIGFLIECFELGFISSEDVGMVPRFGDAETLFYLVDKIIKMEGIGSYFRKGIKGAAEIIGQGSIDIAVQVKNLDLPAHDPRAAFGLAVNYAVSPRGACHERGNPQASILGLFYPELGQDGPPDRFNEDSAAYCATIYQDTSLTYNCMTMCKFMVNIGSLTISEMLREFELVTGRKVYGPEFVKAGERSLNLQRLINVRDGMSKKDDTLSPKMLQPAVVGGRAGKAPFGFEKMLSDYYKLRGWDENGIPTKEKLTELELEDYIKYIP
jgi:aldehyde:ferredoxin oxidoreductase